MNILFSINRSFIPFLTSCLKSIVKNGGAEHYSVYIFHTDLSMDDQKKITGPFVQTVRFHFISVDKRLFDGFPTFKRYPLQIYYRLAAPLLLPKDMDRILYLGVDTVVINSLISLYHSSFDGAYFMACTHAKQFLTKVNQLRLGLDSGTPYVNSGVMLLNLSALRKTVSMDDIRRFAREKREFLLLPDQDILTALYGKRVKLLDSMIYNLNDRVLNLYNANPANEKIDLDWIRKNSVVIHYFGRNKPWKENYRGILNIFYLEYG